MLLVRNNFIQNSLLYITCFNFKYDIIDNDTNQIDVYIFLLGDFGAYVWKQDTDHEYVQMLCKKSFFPTTKQSWKLRSQPTQRRILTRRTIGRNFPTKESSEQKKCWKVACFSAQPTTRPHFRPRLVISSTLSSTVIMFPVIYFLLGSWSSISYVFRRLLSLHWDKSIRHTWWTIFMLSS